MKILHSTSDWLSLTKSWIYDQVRFMPDGVEQAVWCNTLIEGPHNAWKEKVFKENSNLYNNLARRINNRMGEVMLKRKSPDDIFRYDALFSHFGNRAWHDYQYVKGFPLKKIVRFYGVDIGLTPRQPGWMKRYEKIFKEYDLLVCEGPYMARELEKLGAPNSKIKCLYLGIDPGLVATELIATEKLIKPLCILIAGTFTEKKGIEYALQGVLQFAQETKYPVRLTLIGDINPAIRLHLSKKEIIEKISAKIKLEKNIKFFHKSYVPLNELYSQMKENLVFISPSVTAKGGDIEGGFPVTLTHAAANGMILIGTDHCDLPEIVRDQINGYVCKQRSPSSIKECLDRLVNHENKSLQKKRGSSLEIVNNEFNAKVLGKRLTELVSE